MLQFGAFLCIIIMHRYIMKGTMQMKKALCLVLSFLVMTSALVFTQVSAADTDTVIHAFDSTSGFTTAFNSNIAIETGAKTEGSGSARMGFTIPTGQASNIGGMLFYDYSAAQDFSAYDKFKIDIYSPLAMEGKGGVLQINFVTGSSNQDGYNYSVGIDDIYTGWNTITFKKSSYAAHVNNADWANINRLRITWFNNQQISREFILLDNLRGSVSSVTGHTPYAVGEDLMINNADSLDGWDSTEMFNTNLSAGVMVAEGSGSVTMVSTIPQGQASNIGAMSRLSFPATDLSGYSKLQFKVYFSHTLTGTHQFQVNFITGTSGDGYNYVATFSDYAEGWHTFTIDRASISMAATADWTSINAIRFTWFNQAQIATGVGFTFDEIMAINSAHTCTAGSTVYTDASYHWNTCTGCGAVMNKAAHTAGSAVQKDASYHWNVCTGCTTVMNKTAHSGGTATCIAAAKCSTCSQSYGSVNSSNHTGGTEVRNASAATCGANGYTGDTYCKGCGVKTATGSTIASTGNHGGGEATCIAAAKCSTCSQSYGSVNANNHKNTEVRNQTGTYTGDTWCTDCNTMIAQGTTVTPDVTATVATIKSTFKAGDEIAIPVTITEWSNAYAYITVSLPTYDETLLKFDGFETSSTDFSGALGDYGTNGFALIASPSSDRAAEKLKGGEVCIIYFIALADITESTEISVVVKASGYTKGSEDNWIENKELHVVTVNGGIEVPEVDVTGPSVSIGNVTNNVADNQTITVNMSDVSGIAGYYFGTSATYANNTYVATTDTSFTKNITAAGTYYITVVDSLGNVSETISVTFNMITLNANGGSATVQNVLVKNGNTVALPTATRDGYSFIGWATTTTATSGVTSITATANATYYAIWKDATKPVGSVSASNNALANTQTVTITMSDNEAIAGYYFGTSATYTDNTYVATTAASATETVSAAGIYYLTVMDKAGNVSETVSIKFFMITLNANGGTASVQNILAVSGATVELPAATIDGSTFGGWATDANAATGVTSIVASGNATYYAIWNEYDYGNYDGENGVTEVDALNILQVSTGKVELTEEQKKLCDVDGNGVVDNVDALYILQYVVGRITSFPIQK